MQNPFFVCFGFVHQPNFIVVFVNQNNLNFFHFFVLQHRISVGDVAVFFEIEKCENAQLVVGNPI